MTTTTKFTTRLKYDKDWPKWFLELQLQAHEQNVWKYINPKATDAEFPMQPPTMGGTSLSQNKPKENDALDQLDDRQQSADRFAEYFVAANEKVRSGCFVLRSWIHLTVDTMVLYAAQEIANEQGGSLQAVVRALPRQLIPTKSKVMHSFFSSLRTKSSQKLDLLMENTHLRATRANGPSAEGSRSKSQQSTSSHKTYQKIRTMLALLKPTKAKPPQTSSFLKLPHELLLSIIEQLELHDEFILGQTCKAIRHLIRKDWHAIVDRFSSDQKHIFLTRVAFVLPDHWVCGFCQQLHGLEKHDVPWQEEACNRCAFDRKGVALTDMGFEIRERHVQLALKLTRLQTSNRDYLEKLMSPFTHEFNSYRSPMRQHFRASPKIVQERFLLHTQLEMVHETILTLDDCDGQEVCPHMTVDSDDHNSRWLCSSDNLGRDVRTALSHPGNEITGHCPCCPTDYAIIAGPDNINIQAWKDFGSYKSPKDESWTVHVESDQEWRSVEPTICQDPGSIRRLYVTGDGKNTQR